MRDRKNKETHKLRAIARNRKRILKKLDHDSRLVEKHKPERGYARALRRQNLPNLTA